MLESSSNKERDGLKSSVAGKLNILKMILTERVAYQEYMNKTLKKRDYIVSGIEKRNAEIAKNLLLKNIDINIIADSTGLTTEEIEQLKAEIERPE